MARPSKYEKQFDEQARKLCQMFGATDEQLAQWLNVSASTIDKWKAQNEEFLRSIKSGKNAADDKVEESLYKRACGFTRTVQKLTQQGDVMDCDEEMPPDTTACIFWLCNRRPDSWKRGETAATPAEQPITLNFYRDSSQIRKSE